MLDIIIPTYKARTTLSAALDSLVAQTKKLFIVTIVQDCDGEDYSDIIKTYTERGLHIRLLSTEKNGGPGVARQLGIDSTFCQHIMFLDSDDMLMPQAVECLTREIIGNDADLVCSSMLMEQEKGIYTPLNVDEVGCQWCAGKIYSTSYLRDNNIRFREDIRRNEDSYFNLVATYCAKKKLYLKQLNYLWRKNPNSLTRENKGETFFEKGWLDYVKSQIYAMEKIEEVSGRDCVDEALVLNCLCNIYTTSMEGIYANSQLEELESFLERAKQNKRIQEVIHDKDFYKAAAPKLRQTGKVKGEFFFYPINFKEWIERYIKDDLYS